MKCSKLFSSKMVKDSVYSNIKDVLEVACVCRRCILRFFAEKEYTCYISKTNIENAIQKLTDQKCDLLDKAEFTQDDVGSNETDFPVKRFLPSPCAACLGILQNDCDEMISKIDNVVNKHEYKFKDFVLQVSLPVVADLRDKLFYLFLKDKLGDSYSFDATEIPSVKDICKWVIGSQFGKLTQTDFTPSSDFQILLSAVYPETVKECLVLFNKCPEAFPNSMKRKVKVENIYSKNAVLKALETLSSEIKNFYSLPPSPPNKYCTFSEIQCTRSSLFLGGRYNKYSRELSQTPWLVDGERRMDSSVNEFITDVVQKRILCDKIIFSASGREDVDVKMLGNGRPFVLELLNPRCLEWAAEEMKTIEDEINNSTNAIAIKDLQVISKLDTSLLKEGEEGKRKSYSALCMVEKTLTHDDITKLEGLKDLMLNQKTPIRVLHRRTLATRERLLHSIQAKMLNDHQLQLRLETQAGTYVKEFVHGDFNRTIPNLGTLLNTRADILELDVECIHLDFPPKPAQDDIKE